MNPPGSGQDQDRMPSASSTFSSKFLVLFGGLLLLIFISVLINGRSERSSLLPYEINQITQLKRISANDDRTDRIYRQRNAASVVPASLLMNSSNGTNTSSKNRNNVFSLKALTELRLFAPTLKPIIPAAQSKPATVPKPAAQTKAPIPTTVTAPASPAIVNPLDLPVLKPIANPLELAAPGHNENPATAVVNILCSQAIGKSIKQISSSGVLISSSGLILTNAHVGIQPFIATYGAAGQGASWTCKIRSGSPAQTSHSLSFVYIPSSWTARHKGETAGSVSIDSGNSDFAILKASNPADILKFATPISLRNAETANPLELFALGNKNDSSLSFSPNLNIGQGITAIAYPIMSSDSNALMKNQDNLQIRDLFGFAADQGHEHDLIETTASSLGRSGASGGAIVDSSKHLIAIIANIIPTNNPSQAYIRAISLDHINASLLLQTGIRLNTLMNSDGSALKQIFESRYLQSVKEDLL